MSLHERVALVADAGSAIGNAIAKKLASQGARVVVGGDDGRKLAATVESIQGSGGKAETFTMKAGDDESAQAAVRKAIDAFGKLDIAVSAWDFPCRAPLLSIGAADIDQTLTAKLRSAIALGRAAAEPMKKQGYGRLVMLASRDWLGGSEGPVYAAASAGIIGLTRSLAWELVQHGITANCVAPGLIQDETTAALPADVLDELLKEQPVRRLGTPEEVAKAVVFFAADESSNITGQTLYVCGGKSAFSSLTA